MTLSGTACPCRSAFQRKVPESGSLATLELLRISRPTWHAQKCAISGGAVVDFRGDRLSVCRRRRHLFARVSTSYSIWRKVLPVLHLLLNSYNTKYTKYTIINILQFGHSTFQLRPEAATVIIFIYSTYSIEGKLVHFFNLSDDNMVFNGLVE